MRGTRWATAGLILGTLILAGIVAALIAVAIQSHDAITQIQSEGADRRDQTCLLFERQHLQDVSALKRTYDYLVNLTADDLKDPLNQAVLHGISETEDKAKASIPPSYCAPTDVGSPIPFPKLPQRPPEIDALLNA